ncbi:MAG: sorbitol dehydrogenase family protein [Halomonas sp.]|nr:sugar dehydrogenase complex small subunit [Halomonas sp.]MDN6315670.1 sorbitol dehydrogenase family protein [Halomonas sp.]MDN6337127.1 sorbitol dehydrogenase family protein [Halomonas sp.]
MSTREDIAGYNDQLPGSARINSPSRRRVLKLGVAGLGVVALSSLSLSTLAANAESGHVSHDDATFAAFVTLSAWLLSDKTLDERLGQRLFEALERIPADNVPGMDHLPALKQKLVALGETRDHLTEDDLDASEMRLVRRLLQAWMLGTVGHAIDDPAAEVIAYEHAAMYAGPRDVQVVRTYCPNQPGFWAERPA